MKSLVIGASGLVGSAVWEALEEGERVGTFSARPAPGLSFLDLREIARDPLSMVRTLERVRPSVVYLCAGLVSPDLCEADEAGAGEIHVDGPAAVARGCAAAAVRVVYFSTDNVFDGFSGPFVEADGPNPVNAFGRTKLAGEEAVLRECPGSLVLRTCALYGPEPRGEGLAYRLVGALRAGRPVPVSSDQYLTPTYSRDLASAAVALAEAGANGVFHVAGPEVVNAASFAMAVAREAGCPVSLVSPYPTAALSLPALRPQRGGLRSTKIKDIGTVPPRPMKEAFAHWRSNQRGALWPF